VPTGPVCPNGACEAGENCGSCAADCVCKSGEYCNVNKCEACNPSLSCNAAPGCDLCTPGLNQECNCDGGRLCVGGVCEAACFPRGNTCDPLPPEDCCTPYICGKVSGGSDNRCGACRPKDIACTSHGQCCSGTCSLLSGLCA
jgi:hypothetical protein